ncbi:universal stress protein [Solirubrum puertoriconensis]|uniref:universal stress protein n=1 Tax=Solirubrum puertoriconensis TaxID=1751427 RepID=UPI00136625DF|nr:universal stress protein [Solirubrum puertoriconensis]
MSKVLCPLDFSAATLPLLAYAAALARATGAELCLLHVQEPQPVLSGADEQAGLDVTAELAQAAQVARQAGAARVSTHLRHGDAAREIVRAAEESGADLMVIGSHGQTGLTRFLMGNTAEYVVRTAPCATLLVKPQGTDAYRRSA